MYIIPNRPVLIIWLSHLTSKQCLKVRSSIIDINNHFNQVFSAFDNLNKELFLGFYLIDTWLQLIYYMWEFKTVDSNYFTFTFTFLISQFLFVTSFSFISGDSGLGLMWQCCHLVTLQCYSHSHMSHGKV